MDPENKIKLYEPAVRKWERLRPTAAVRAEPVERKESADLLACWRVLRKRRWTILTVFFVLFTVVLLGTLKQKPIYRAKALLEVAKENPNILTVQELFALDTVSDTYLETQFKILQSDTLARRVIEGFVWTSSRSSTRERLSWATPSHKTPRQRSRLLSETRSAIPGPTRPRSKGSATG